MKDKDSKDMNYWHEPFLYALKLELYDYKDILTFESEHKLSEEALRIDILVIKKNKDKSIKKNIGASFKEHNIFEFKSETDGLYVDDYNKVLGYTYLYIAFNKVKLEDVTINFVTGKKPRALFEYLRLLNLEIIEKEKGIYEIIGGQFPVKIIITKKLSIKENTFLNSLRSNLETIELEQTLKKYSEYEEFKNKNVFLSRLITANSKTFKEVMKTMPEAVLLDLEEALSGTILEERWTKKGKAEGKAEGISYLAKLIREGHSLNEAVEIAMKMK